MKKYYWSLSCVCAVLMAGQSKYLNADTAPPKVYIRSISVPKSLSQPLIVTFDIMATGKTPVAISRENIGFELWAPGTYSRCGGVFVFSNTVPQPIITQATNHTLVIGMVLTNNANVPWYAAGPGKYTLQVSTGSGKLQNFDYEWMGQLHSDGYEFELK